MFASDFMFRVGFLHEHRVFVCLCVCVSSCLSDMYQLFDEVVQPVSRVY